MKQTGYSLLLAALALFTGAAAHADAVLSVVPFSGSVTAGQQFTVGVYVTGPTISHNGQTIPSDVTTSPRFSLTLPSTAPSAEATPPAASPGKASSAPCPSPRAVFFTNGGTNPTFFESGTIDNAAGTISNIADVGLSGVTGSGYLVDITFQALQAGTTSIAILANSDLQFYRLQLQPHRHRRFGHDLSRQADLSYQSVPVNVGNGSSCSGADFLSASLSGRFHHPHCLLRRTPYAFPAAPLARNLDKECFGTGTTPPGIFTTSPLTPSAILKLKEIKGSPAFFAGLLHFYPSSRSPKLKYVL